MTAETIINHAICRKSSKIHIRVIAVARGKKIVASPLACLPPHPLLILTWYSPLTIKYPSVTYKLLLPSVTGFRLMLSLEFE